MIEYFMKNNSVILSEINWLNIPKMSNFIVLILFNDTYCVNITKLPNFFVVM